MVGGVVSRYGLIFGWLLGAVMGGWSGATTAWAQEDVSDWGWRSVEVHGFASQGFILTTDNNYLVTDTERGSFQLSEAGINFSKQLTGKLRMGIQLFVQNFGATGSYNLTADWFHLDYHFRDWLGFRAGRLKLPFGLFNEINDIDSARLPVLLPQSVYPLQARNFLFAHTGAELYGFARSRALGALDYRLFGGTIFIDPALLNPPHSSASVAANVPFVIGGRVLWETPLSGLRVGGSLQKVRLDVTAYVGMLTVAIENNTFMWVASTDYASGALSLAAEYSRWHTEQTSSLPDRRDGRHQRTGLCHGQLWPQQLAADRRLLRAPLPRHQQARGRGQPPARRGVDLPLRHQRALAGQARGPLHGGRRRADRSRGDQSSRDRGRGSLGGLPDEDHRLLLRGVRLFAAGSCS